MLRDAFLHQPSGRERTRARTTPSQPVATGSGVAIAAGSAPQDPRLAPCGSLCECRSRFSKDFWLLRNGVRGFRNGGLPNGRNRILNSELLFLDGATGTELNRRGVGKLSAIHLFDKLGGLGIM